ncbi:ankyrin repeat domain-containing protein 39 [Aplysia californica]|uniref:Ankyrin repeat domain-containing protein 39 n=1 Tax=Aplysia californica TaxID=6500 RepID=A0ABM0JW05_APLCA|nr:ankyrin repeat domain-containing protein 39 [Aplysia californica]
MFQHGCSHNSEEKVEHNCHHHLTNPSVHQTLEELDFDRGIWSSALAGDIDDVTKKLKSDNGAHVNDTDKSGYTALHYASRSGHLDICQLLLSHGANVNVRTSSSGATPLHRAAYMNHSQVVRLLLDHGADPLVIDCDGMTPLHKAAEKGAETTVEFLIKADSSALEIQDNKGRKPEALAKSEAVKELLRQK